MPAAVRVAPIAPEQLEELLPMIAAQRLYDRTGATRSTWVEYDLEL